MATITDNDLKMFQERARTELASGCDTGGIAWDSVIWDLCNEVRRLRSASKESERGDEAKLREALVRIRGFADRIVEDRGLALAIINACDSALAAPPRNCDVYNNESCRMAYHLHGDGLMTMQAFADWLFAPATEKEGGAK